MKPFSVLSALSVHCERVRCSTLRKCASVLVEQTSRVVVDPSTSKKQSHFYCLFLCAFNMKQHLHFVIYRSTRSPNFLYKILYLQTMHTKWLCAPRPKLQHAQTGHKPLHQDTTGNLNSHQATTITTSTTKIEHDQNKRRHCTLWSTVYFAEGSGNAWVCCVHHKLWMCEEFPPR